MTLIESLFIDIITSDGDILSEVYKESIHDYIESIKKYYYFSVRETIYRLENLLKFYDSRKNFIRHKDLLYGKLKTLHNKIFLRMLTKNDAFGKLSKKKNIQCEMTNRKRFLTVLYLLTNNIILIFLYIYCWQI